MSINQIRVKILLNDFFTDHRSKAYVAIDRSWKDVKELQKHIGSLFNVKKFYLTTVDGFFLPPHESINVINSEDTLIAHLNVFEPIDTPPTSNDQIAMDFTNEINRFSSLASEFQEKTNLNDSDLLSISLKKRKRIRKRKRKPTVDGIETYSKVFCVEPEQTRTLNAEVPVTTLNDFSETPKENTSLNKNVTELNEPVDAKRKYKKFEKPPNKLKTNLNTKPSLHIRFSDTDDDEEEDENDDQPDGNDNAEQEDIEFVKLPPNSREIKASYSEIDINIFKPNFNQQPIDITNKTDLNKEQESPESENEINPT